MALFGYKNDIHEYKCLLEFKDNIDALLGNDKYISRKEYLPYVDSVKEIYDKLVLMENEKVLFSWCKNNKTDYKKLLLLIKRYEEVSRLVSVHNDKYVSNHLKLDCKYLDEILKDDDPNIVLDDEQRRVVLSDEDYTLVVAGAGAGKTTTIEAKVKYLVEKQNILPNRILIVSFTRKATKELKDRFSRLNIPVEIATFHSIGNTIIKNNELVRHKIVSNGFMFDSIREYLSSKLDDEYFIKKLVLFFASYLNMPFNESDTTMLFKTFQNDGETTLKQDLQLLLDDYKNKQDKNRHTLKDERVRSNDECKIANFLFINGIDYEYEPVYRYGFKDTTKPYCPDFLIKQDGKEIYLEHFGLTQDARNNRFSKQELEDYKKHINDKIRLHREHNTNLIYTFTKYNDGRDLITHLKEELLNANIRLDTKSDIEIYRAITKNVEDKYFNKFIQLVCNFISRFKVNNYSLSKFDEWKISLKDERTKLFVDICYKCFLAYSKALKEEKAIDFEDMINNASNILDEKIKNNEMIDYDYILIDEYQDISLQRFDLAERISKCSNAKIIAVGDDWQSIFKFSGAKIDLFTKFEEKMGYANVLKITKTYRNSKELIDIAGGFIMKNNEQIKKSLQSNKTIKDPVILMSYDDSYKDNKDPSDKGPYYRLGEAIEKSLDDIVINNGNNKSILIIGRYNFDGRNLAKLVDFFAVSGNKIISKKYPKLKIEFLTAHSSKGLGYDNVIIINGKDDVLGFPSKIEDDPVMKLVIKEDESIDFSEERRLFYVALTRTKNRVYIVTPRYKPSKFILEIKDQFSNVILRGVELNAKEGIDVRIKCPMCGYPLQRRGNNNFKFSKTNTKLWICSNDPEICGFISNDLKGGKLAISKCLECEDGYLVVKPIRDKNGKDSGERMLGCTNYNKDGSGCNGKLFKHDFSQDKNILALRFYSESMSLDRLVYANISFKELINIIFYTIKEANELYSNYKINITSLIDILVGDNSKVVESFKLDKLRYFNYVSKDNKNRLWRLVRVLENNEYIKYSSNEYNVIEVLKDSLDDSDLRILFSMLIDK